MSIHVRSFVVAIICSTALGCGSGSEAPVSHTTKPAASSETPPAASGAVTVFPTKVFVGVDEDGAMAPAPVTLSGGSGASWVSSNTAVASVSAMASGAKISAVKTGSSTVTAKVGSASADVAVTVLTYTKAAKAAGQAEYMKAGCDGCHGSADGPDITPSGVGKHTDEQILGAALQAQNPEGGAVDSPNHKFDVTTAIVAYLRSLPAKTDTPKQDN